MTASLPPGGGCSNLRGTHSHWCANCRTGRLFTREQCVTLPVPPLCTLCGSRDWRSEDEVIELQPSRVAFPHGWR